MPRKGQKNTSPARKESFSTYTDRDDTNLFRLVKKVIKQKMKSGDTMKMPPSLVSRLAEDMCEWYKDHWDRNLDKDGLWDDKIRELLTK
jgi:hypothetical protein